MAANGRRTLSVCTHAAADANGFLMWRVVWIGGGVLLNGVTAAAIARNDREFGLRSPPAGIRTESPVARTAMRSGKDCGF